jgi:peptidoglycan hydrolase CwlO-like protein
MAVRRAALFLILASAHQLQVTNGLSLSANPIRRVVTMLQMMHKKIEAEGKAEEKLYDKFMCWCQTGAGDLNKSIQEAETKIPQLESSIKETEAEVGQLAADLEKAKKDREEANEVVANGKALRAKEAAAFAKESGEMKANLNAMSKAIAALEKGMSGAFLQTSGASVLRKLVINMDLSSSDRDVLASFLSQGQTTGYAPASGEIVGILKQMNDTMDSDLKEITEAEEKAKADFEGMMKAKAAQIAALTKEIEEKTERLGNKGVELVNMKEDLDDTQKSLAEDKAFLADLDKNCATKKARVGRAPENSR